MHRPSANPLLSGAVVAAVLVVATVAVVVSGIPGGPQIPLPWTQTMSLRVQLSDADALEPHASVEISGVKVGEVQSISADGDLSLVTLRLQQRYSDIHDDATVFVRPHGLFGPKYIDIVPGTAAAPVLRDGGTIDVAHTVQPVDLDAILQDLQAPEQQNLRTAIVELGKASAARGDDVNQLIVAADSLSQVLDNPLVALDRVSPELNGLVVDDESFNRSFQQAPLGRLIADSESSLQVFAANESHLQSLLINADAALSSLDRSLSGEAGDVQQALRTLGQVPRAPGQTPATVDKLTEFTYLLGLFGANLTDKETRSGTVNADPFDQDVTGGIVDAIENVRSAFASYDPCTPGVNHCPASGPLAGQAHYLRVQVFNFPPGGSPSSSVSICGLPIFDLPGLPTIACPASSRGQAAAPSLPAGDQMAGLASLFAS